jgi:hypothetical protein
VLFAVRKSSAHAFGVAVRLRTTRRYASILYSYYYLHSKILKMFFVDINSAQHVGMFREKMITEEKKVHHMKFYVVIMIDYRIETHSLT